MDEDALGTEVYLGPGHIVLDGDPPPPCTKRAQQLQAHVYCYHGRPSHTAELFYWYYHTKLLMYSIQRSTNYCDSSTCIYYSVRS